MKNIFVIISMTILIASCKKPVCPDPVEPDPDPVNSESLKIGLAAYLPFTGNAGDSSGYANDGTVNGAVLTTDRFGNSNMAYSFDGVNDYISIPPAILMNENYSYAMWMKANELPANTLHASLISIGINLGDQVMGINNNYNGFTGWSAGGYDVGGTGTTYLSPTLPSISVWYHAVCTRDNSSVKFYLNGVLQGMSAAPALPYYGAGGQVAHLGARFNPAQYFTGVIDDVRIYNRALSAAEVLLLYRLN